MIDPWHEPPEVPLPAPYNVRVSTALVYDICRGASLAVADTTGLLGADEMYDYVDLSETRPDWQGFVRKACGAFIHTWWEHHPQVGPDHPLDSLTEIL